MKKVWTALFSLLLLSNLLMTSAGFCSPMVFFVSPAGSDQWSGTHFEPNGAKTDGPFATLEKARDAVRSLSQAGKLPWGGMTVYIRGGLYSFDDTFSLTTEDSGTINAPVHWRAYPGEKVVFTGGKFIDDFQPVTDKKILKRIEKKYRDKILQVDLKASGITDYGIMDPKGENKMELFFKKEFMTVARYPNEGWLLVKDVPQTGTLVFKGEEYHTREGLPAGRHYGRITYDSDRPKRWKNLDDLYLHGYWVWDWSDTYQQVTKIDTKKHEFHMKAPHHNYGYTRNQRYCAINILEELDTPGEWYLDRASGILYFWPPSPIGQGDVLISVLVKPMVKLVDASYITIEGITFEGTRGNAVFMEGGTSDTVAGCTFVNIGLTTVVVLRGTGNGVKSCDIFNVGAGGIALGRILPFGGSGPLKILSPEGNFAINNHIYDYSQRLRTWQQAVTVTGVGNRVAHNYIHDAPHQGILFQGNDHIIEFNEIHDIAKETGDCGGINTGRNWTWRGNVIRYNYLHDLHGPGYGGVRAVYLDDWTCGTTIYGNVFYRAKRAAHIGGGKDNIVANNIFIECEPSIDYTIRRWEPYFDGRDSLLFNQLKEVDYKNPPYSIKYPELMTMAEDEPSLPTHNFVVRNISVGGKWLEFPQDLEYTDRYITLRNNVIADPVLFSSGKRFGEMTMVYTRADTKFLDILKRDGNIVLDGDPGFLNLEKLDVCLKDNSPAYSVGFEPIPVECIGLYVDEYRIKLPERK